MFERAASEPFWCPHLFLTYLLCLAQLSSSQEALYPSNRTHTPLAAPEGNLGTSNHSAAINGTTQSSATSTITTDPISALSLNTSTLWTHPTPAAPEGNPGTSNHSSAIDGTTQSSATSTITTDLISALAPNTSTLWTHTPLATTEENPGTSNHSSAIDEMSESSATSTITTDILGHLICLHNSDCPPYSSCLTQHSGIFICQCDMGYFLHVTLGCIMARTFPARVSLSALRWNPDAPWSEEPMLQEKMWSLSTVHVRTLFRAALGSLDGYLSTSIHRLDLPGGHALVLHYFSPLYPVSEQLVDEAVKQSLSSCADGPGCVLSADVYQVLGLSLCHVELCDPLSSSCTHQDGLLSCLCRDGYYKHHTWDRSCTACESGFQWNNGSCLRCGFGFGGFNCNESFLLTMVVEACVLCVLGIAFIVLLFHYMRKKKAAKPTLMDGITLRFPSDQPVIRLPRPQFSLRSTWDWDGPPLSPGPNTQPDKDPTSETPEIQLKTFGESPRSASYSQYRGSNNLAFISDD